MDRPLRNLALATERLAWQVSPSVCEIQNESGQYGIDKSEDHKVVDRRLFKQQGPFASAILVLGDPDVGDFELDTENHHRCGKPDSCKDFHECARVAFDLVVVRCGKGWTLRGSGGCGVQSLGRRAEGHGSLGKCDSRRASTQWGVRGFQRNGWCSDRSVGSGQPNSWRTHCGGCSGGAERDCRGGGRWLGSYGSTRDWRLRCHWRTGRFRWNRWRWRPHRSNGWRRCRESGRWHCGWCVSGFERHADGLLLQRHTGSQLGRGFVIVFTHALGSYC